ncbi:MAG: lipase [Leptospiraceae bacterium]|nr:lipase [Leptospiraceae bacterium]
MSFIRNRLRLLLLLSIAIPVGLECALRLFQPAAFTYYRSLKELHISHPDYLVALTPHADIILKDNKGLWEGRFRTNSLGMRGSRELDPQQEKIACLGDSMVMGFGVSDQDAFCTLLDNLEIRGKRYQTLNLAVDAFGSRGYAKRLDEVSAQTRLKAVLLFVSPNDYTMPEALRARGILADDENDEIRFNDPAYLRMFRWRFTLTRYSYLAHAVLVGTQQVLIRAQLLQRNLRTELVKMGLQDCDPVTNAYMPYEPGIWNWIRFAFYRSPSVATCKVKSQQTDKLPQPVDIANNSPGRRSPETKTNQCPAAIPATIRCLTEEPAALAPLEESTIRYYSKMIELSQKRGFTLIVAPLPIQDQTLYCSQAGLYSPLYDYALRAGKWFQAHNAIVLDLRNYTKEICSMRHADGRLVSIADIYIQGDGHYTVTGNHWIARALASELKKLHHVF